MTNKPFDFHEDTKKCAKVQPPVEESGTLSGNCLFLLDKSAGRGCCDEDHEAAANIAGMPGPTVTAIS